MKTTLHPLELFMASTQAATGREVKIGLINGMAIVEQVETSPNRYQYAKHALMSDGLTWKTFIEPTYDKYTPLQKTPLVHPPPPTPYESEQALYNNVKDYIHKHLDLPHPNGYDILTAFVLKTWVEEFFDFTAYIGFFGRQETGKTRGLEVLRELCFRAWHTTGITTATLFRLTDKLSPTLLLDESEFLTGDEQKNLIGLLNSGQRRGVLIPRMKEDLEEFDFFNVYGSKALSGTKRLKSTTQSRMITFTMTKNVRPIPRTIDTETGAKLRSQLLSYRFAKIAANINHLKAATEYPELKPLSGRNFELFDPLFHVAATPEAKANILGYALETQQSKLQAEKTELSSTVFEAILKVKDSKAHNGLLLLKDIANYINMNQEPRYWITERRIGSRCTQMGFEKTRTNKGTAIILSNTLIERLCKDARYSATLLNFRVEGEEGERKKGYAKDWLEPNK
jgi:hypothetical protein